MTAEPVSQLESALSLTGELIAGVSDSQWADPTPCAQWSVRDLVGHLVAGNFGFARAVSGEPPSAAGDSNWSDSDLPSAYRHSAPALTEAFGQPGALEKIVTVPVGPVPGIVALHLRLVELLVHGWDLAQAIGKRVTFPEDLAEQELAFTRGMLADIPPGRSPFAPPRPVADDASAIDRLAACLGRDVTSHAAATRNSP